MANQRWDLLLRIASLVCTAVVIPGIGWAWSTTQTISDVRARLDILAHSVEQYRQREDAVVEELRHLRASVESMKTDVLQRLTKVETKLETR